MKRVLVTRADFDLAAEVAALEQLGPGGIASFSGIVRGDGGVVGMTLEHYPGMTELALDVLAERALERWPLLGITLIHRVGRLAVGERIVLVATASAHRSAALDACSFMIDRLKTDVPFWKKEERSDGTGHWVAARESDEAAAARWA